MPATYLVNIISRMEKVSTRTAAKRLKISFTSINRYIADKKIPMPPVVKVGGVKVRLWSNGDIERVRAMLPKIADGRKTRYKKKQQSAAGTARSARPKARPKKKAGKASG